MSELTQKLSQYIDEVCFEKFMKTYEELTENEKEELHIIITHKIEDAASRAIDKEKERGKEWQKSIQ